MCSSRRAPRAPCCVTRGTTCISCVPRGEVTILYYYLLKPHQQLLVSEVIRKTYLLCTGDPRPQLNWYLESALLDDSYEHHDDVTTNSLLLPRLSRELLHARLLCQATNTDLAPPLTTVMVLDLNCKCRLSLSHIVDITTHYINVVLRQCDRWVWWSQTSRDRCRQIDAERCLVAVRGRDRPRGCRGGGGAGCCGGGSHTLVPLTLLLHLPHMTTLERVTTRVSLCKTK